MSNVKKLKIGSTSYDIVDASAAHSLSDVAEAGSNITFTGGESYITNYTVVGSPTISSDFEAGNFSTSNYLTTTLPSLGSDFDIYMKFHVNSLTSGGKVLFCIGTCNDVEGEEYQNVVFMNNVSGQYMYAKTSNDNASNVLTNTTPILMTSNTDYYIKIGSKSTGTYFYYSTTGFTNMTLAYSTSGVTTVPEKPIYIGCDPHFTPKGPFTNGSIYLEDFYIESNSVEVWRAVSDGNPKTVISANVPTVNNSTITFTQGGVTKGSFTLNQSSDETIALDAGGGSASSLEDIAEAGSNITFTGGGYPENFTIVGSPTITSGVVSNFSASNRLLSTDIDLSEPFEIEYAGTVGSTGVHQKLLHLGRSSTDTAIDIGVDSSNRWWFYQIKPEGGSSILDAQIQSSVSYGNVLKGKLTWDGTTYKHYYWNNSSWVQTNSANSSTGLGTCKLYMCCNGDGSEYWRGTIDLADFKVTKNEVVVWQAYDTTIQKTVINATVPTVNNATLTITQGGTTKGTFTANASSDVTIALDAGGGSSLPDQTGNAGKFLTTDGSSPSWATVSGGSGTEVILRRL